MNDNDWRNDSRLIHSLDKMVWFKWLVQTLFIMSVHVGCVTKCSCRGRHFSSYAYLTEVKTSADNDKKFNSYSHENIEWWKKYSDPWKQFVTLYHIVILSFSSSGHSCMRTDRLASCSHWHTVKKQQYLLSNISNLLCLPKQTGIVILLVK